MKKSRFEDMVIKYVPFVEENNYRYRKTQEFIKTDYQIKKFKAVELVEIMKEIHKLTKRLFITKH